MKKKIGIYICHCGGNISDYVDVEKVKKAVENDADIFLAKTTMFACGDTNQNEMVDDITNMKLNGVVVASCSPKLHLQTFRSVSERAGLNKYQYVHANIREQVSWPHSDDKLGATEKAIKQVKAAIAKARLAEPLEPMTITAQKAVAVIGAGVAGIKAALQLSDMGTQVYLIEREPFVGGRTAQWERIFTSNETGKEIISRLYKDILSRDNITVFTQAEVVDYSGSIGDFKLMVKVAPRFIREHCVEDNLQKAIDVCPVEVPDSFNFEINSRKAIYNHYPSEYPYLPVIDIQNCTRCGECEKVCKNIDFSQKEETLNLQVGSILMATGFDPYTPADNEYGYKHIDNVITLPQFKRLLALNDSKLMYNGKVIKNIAYIYCVGSRQVNGDNKYCSRYCCTSTIHAAIHAKEKFGNINNYHFNRGIRTYGKQELLYDESSRMGDIYLQFFEDGEPQIYKEGNKTIVKVKDVLTKYKELEVEADLVVLVTGMVPRKDNAIGSLLKLPRGRDKFFNEIHMKLRPVETVIDGVAISGACQGPKNVTESVNSALSAATKSFSIVSKGEIDLEPVIAIIDKDNCTWCGACAEACPYDAIQKTVDGDKSYAVLNSTVCKGCGMCLPVCPSDAIDLTAYSNHEIENMIDALL
ncbi:MAG: CoB--CoM heterodisulfide reductase iron-sulfur subunit A family protein [Prolixibacteraceae bacterium]|jgi:heterodisulfide reductase subunit A|nr:CoB--CoM heterodisulfide reductase iron-sulfur subunit A family protein [Prolixibacteraceae bacterium]